MDTMEEVPAIDITNEKAIESEVEERLEVFVRAFVSECEKKFKEFAKEAEVGGTAKPGKIADKVVSPVVGAIGAAGGAAAGVAAGASGGAVGGALALGRAGASAGKAVGEKVIAPFAKFFIGRNHRKRAKKTTQIFETVKTDEQRKMLVEAASLIYFSFQSQFDSVTDADGNWKRALRKLAIDARNRSISYLCNEDMNLAIEALSKDLLTKAVIKGESKDSYWSHVTPKKMQKIVPGSKPGHTVIYEGKEWKTSDIYEKAGLKMEGNNGQTKYYKKKECGNDYGYRWAFSWENDSSCISAYEEDCSGVSEDTRTSLKFEEFEAKIVQILTNINKEDTKLQLDRIEGRVEETKETLETMKEVIVPMKQDLGEIKRTLLSGLPKNDQPKIFTVKEPVKTFTGRERELILLHDKLQTQQKQVVVSQCASISGLGGMGKSEIARKYAYTYHEFYGSCIWIDSETQSSIKQSFHGLAEELQVPIKQKSSNDERKILLIVKDIYKRFSNSKSLFIFDNVNEYEEIKDYLPSNLSPTDEKPTIIITSRNSDWDIGDEGDVGLILLDHFTPEEALSFVKKVLEIEDADTSHDSLIADLTEELCCFPLALRQAASYIKAKKSLISAIENYLDEFRDEKKKRHLMQYKTKRDRYTETTYTTWQITFKNIQENEANGHLAIRLVEIMAYLAADNIPPERFQKLADSYKNINEAVDILLKYSIISVRAWDKEKDEGSESSYSYNEPIANIHRLVQQVVRLWLQEEEREEDVLGTALTQVHDKVPKDHKATLWSFACNYTTLIDNYFSKMCEKTRYFYTCDNVVSALIYLVKDGDTRTIQKMLNHFEGRTDLWRPISTYMLERCLVELNRNDIRREYTGHETHIKALLLFHAEVFNALKHSYTKDLELFLQSFDKSLINTLFGARTALDWSVHSGKLEFVNLLIETGADVNSPSWSCNALHTALTENHTQIAEYLLDHGADSNATDDEGRTALDNACYFGHLNIVKRLVNTQAKCENGIEVDCKPLYLAAENNQVEILEFLINHEVYRSAMKDHGQPVCEEAAENGSVQVVKYLLDNKLANVNGRDWKNETLLSFAVNNNRFDIVQYLLCDETPDKVDINAYDVLGITPLYRAVLRGNVQITRFLVEHGAAVENVQNGNTLLGQLNISALHLAVAYNHTEIVKFLVEECNADINMGLNTTFSPLQVAKYFASEEVCEFLIRNGAVTSEWSTANLENIICIIRSFVDENEKTDTFNNVLWECRSVLYNLHRINPMYHNYSEDVERQFKILASILEKLQIDLRAFSEYSYHGFQVIYGTRRNKTYTYSC